MSDIVTDAVARAVRRATTVRTIGADSPAVDPFRQPADWITRLIDEAFLQLSLGQMASSPLQWLGTWDAAANVPELADGDGDAGDTYRVAVAGERDLGAGLEDWTVGDLVIYSEAGVWERSPANDLDDLRIAAIELNQARKAILSVNVKDATYGPSIASTHGAIADGASHPLSNYFATLPAAQAVYPHALSLDDQLDWAACQKAQNAAGVLGDDVYHPRGTYLLGGRTYAGAANVLNRGAGQGATTLRELTDQGLGEYAVTSAPGQVSATHWEHLTVQGPRAFSMPTVDVRSCLMDGFHAASWCHMTECQVIGFGANIVVTGNHQKLTNVRATLGYFNLYFGDNAGDDTTGDQAVIGCTFDFAAMANVAVHGSNAIVDGYWTSTHLGFAPYAFLKFDDLDAGGVPISRAGGVGASTGGLLVNCHLVKVQFEEVGNGCILDESTGGGNGTSSLIGTTFDECVHTDGPTYRIAGRPRDYAVDVRLARGSVVRTGGLGFAKLDVATYRIPIGGLRVEGSYEAGMFSPDTTVTEGLDVIAGSRIMRGFVATHALTAGDIVEHSLNGYQVERYGTVDKRPIVGVVEHAAAAGTIVLVCLPPGDALVNSDATQYGGLYMVPGGSGLQYRAKEAIGFGMSQFAHEPFTSPAFAISKTSSPAGRVPVTLIAEQDERGDVMPQAVNALPAPGSAWRGRQLILYDAGGGADKLYVCLYNGAGAFTWTLLS